MQDEVLIEAIYHATVAKNAKVDKKEAIRSDLCGLCVMCFSKLRAPRAREELIPCDLEADEGFWF